MGLALGQNFDPGMPFIARIGSELGIRHVIRRVQGKKFLRYGQRVMRREKTCEQGPGPVVGMSRLLLKLVQ